MTAAFQLRLLGPMELRQNGRLSDGFKSQKAVALLAYLAHSQQPVSRQRLADLFWGDVPEKRGRANLSWTLSNLRQLLPDFLAADRNTIHFLPTDDFWLDTAAFTTLTARNQLADTTKAAALYRGPFMDAFFLDGCPEFELWLVEERERWHQRAVQTLRILIDEQERKANWQEALRYTRRLLALDPWREEAHRAAMRLLTASGQRSAALAQYETCRRLLVAELGVEPTAETMALYQQIRQGEGQPAPPAPLHGRLPVPPTPFIGRETEVALIQSQLSNPDCKLLTLVGPGGIGKTRLALEAARRVQEQGQPVYFVPLAALDDPADLPVAIAQSLGFSFHSPTTLFIQLSDHLKSRKLVLLLDNFEQLQAAAPRLADLSAQAPNLKLLVTSRSRLNLRGEWAMPVEGLPHRPEQRDRDSAARLFFQTARRADPAFVLTEAETAAIAEICELVGGMPLAIELSATWVRLLSCREIAAEIRQNLEFLTTTMPDIPERHRSLSTIFNQSWERLTGPEQTAAATLAIFRGGFHRRAAEAVAGASLPILFSLIDSSFIYKTVQGRYEMVEALRQFCEARLKEDLDRYEQVREAHARYFTDLIKAQESWLHSPREKEALATIGLELDNVRRAWRWAVQHRSPAVLDQCQTSLSRFYQLRGLLAEGATAFAEAVTALETHPDSQQVQAARARLLVRHGRFLYELGKSSEARTSLEQALTLARSAGDGRTEIIALTHLGSLAREMDDPPLAQSYLNQALPMALAAQDSLHQAIIHGSLGHLFIRKGQHKEATHHLQESLALFRRLGDSFGMAGALNGLGGIAYENARYPDARGIFEESLALCRDIGNRTGIASALAVLGAIAEGRGSYQEAAAKYRECLTIFEEIGTRKMVARMYNNLGNIATLTGDYNQARTLLEQGLALSLETASRRSQSRALNCLGEVYRAQGSYQESVRLHRESLAIRREIGDRWGAGYSLVGLGQTHLLLDETAAAAACFQEALDTFTEIGNRRGTADCLIYLGQVKVAAGAYQTARQHFQQALETALTTRATPQALTAVYGLAQCLVEEGETEKAVPLLDLVVGDTAVPDNTRQAAQQLSQTLPPPSQPTPTLTLPEVQPFITNKT